MRAFPALPESSPGNVTPRCKGDFPFSSTGTLIARKEYWRGTPCNVGSSGTWWSSAWRRIPMLPRRPLLALALLAFLLTLVQQPATTAAQSQVTWKPLRIGAGGWLTGIDISTDGSTRVVRTDTYGAYILTTQWQQLVTATSMPATDATVDKNAGVYEIRIAPGTPTRLYMAYRGYIYRSNNSGGTWSLTSFSNIAMDPNDGYRMFGPKMAVDPANADVVYAGTAQNGLWVTTDGGTSWTRVTAGASRL